MRIRLPRKLLIANRGEIACRIMRTCRRLGVLTVAVYSDADRNSLHVRSADEAVRLGPPPAQESYLSIARVLDAARASGADAVHPGYGFLSENAAFAEACAAAGLVFVGPTPEAIRAMGSKSEAKLLMQGAGVPLTPGYHGEDQRPEFLLEQASSRIGFPLLIKASAGGGGKGMRRVDRSDDFLAALGSCKREAAAAFGDDRVLIERYVLQPRHIEVQVFGDSHGHVVSLFERDCSVQRRHQKVLEEAPAPGLSEERRQAISQAAREAARAVRYTGAGTVEFIADQSGNFFFMEMNTRLQVEHPVTEMVTGLDLVEWQLRVAAAGEPLPLRQDDLRLNGHSVEARIYAEDPANNFAPSVGRLAHLRLPAPSRHVRVDTGVEQGDEVTAWYDPMIAKLIAWDHFREGALKHLSAALLEFQVVGVKTNLQFLHRLVNTPSFTAPELDTDLLEREREHLFAEEAPAPEEACLFAVLSLLSAEADDARKTDAASPWSRADGWRLASTLSRRFSLTSVSQLCDVLVTYTTYGYTMSVAEKQFNVRLEMSDVVGATQELTATIDGHRMTAAIVRLADTLHVYLAGNAWEYQWQNPLAAATANTVEESTILSPMPGIVSAVLIEPGVFVEKDTPIIVLEAMKMEFTIVAPAAGHVREFLYAQGDQVPEGTQLFQFEPAAEKPAG